MPPLPNVFPQRLKDDHLTVSKVSPFEIVLSSPPSSPIEPSTVMSTAASPPSVFPSAPFDGEHADIILRSAEGDDFRVYKAILREASPVFRDMLALPQPNPQHLLEINDDELPVINVTESSRALDNLLRICYPIPSPKITAMKEIEQVLEAALKYDIKLAIEEMRKALKGCCNAVGVFAQACVLKWEDEARQAARNMLKEAFGPFHPSLGRISAAVYHRLFEYHKKASKTVATLFNESTEACRTDLSVRQVFLCQNGRCRATTEKFTCCGEHMAVGVYRSAWWQAYAKIVKGLVLEAPLREDIYNAAFVLECITDATDVCPTCKTNVLKKWVEVSHSLRSQRDREVSYVTIDLSSAGISLSDRYSPAQLMLKARLWH